MIQALIWAGAVVALGVFAILRTDRYLRDKHGVLRITKVGIAERLFDLAVREATKAEEIALRKVQLERTAAKEQILLERADELAAEQLALEKARLQIEAETTRSQGLLELARAWAKQLLEAYNRYLEENADYISREDRLGLGEFAQDLENYRIAAEN